MRQPPGRTAPALLVLALLMLALHIAPPIAVARAQAPSIQGTPPTPPGLSPSASDASTPQPAGPTFSWVARGTAKLQALDKVNAKHEDLEVKVGQQARFGSLTISVLGCVARPPDQPQDAAAFLAITDSMGAAGAGGNGAEPIFHAWMFSAQPALSMLQHPIYDVRVIGCLP